MALVQEMKFGYTSRARRIAIDLKGWKDNRRSPYVALYNSGPTSSRELSCPRMQIRGLSLNNYFHPTWCLIPPCSWVVSREIGKVIFHHLTSVHFNASVAALLQEKNPDGPIKCFVWLVRFIKIFLGRILNASVWLFLLKPPICKRQIFRKNFSMSL
jgi:hypothetical protein